MIFDAHIPEELTIEEQESYGTRVTIDQGGVDIRHYGETISGSFTGQRNEDIALAVLGEDFEHLQSQAERLVMLGSFTEEGFANLGWVYLKASQIIRATREAKRPASLEPAA